MFDFNDPENSYNNSKSKSIIISIPSKMLASLILFS